MYLRVPPLLVDGLNVVHDVVVQHHAQHLVLRNGKGVREEERG